MFTGQCVFHGHAISSLHPKARSHRPSPDPFRFLTLLVCTRSRYLAGTHQMAKLYGTCIRSRPTYTRYLSGWLDHLLSDGRQQESATRPLPSKVNSSKHEL
ncbi:hypothetical protein VTH06DRAFT_5449 [Thermothelomyces fergusii]